MEEMLSSMSQLKPDGTAGLLGDFDFGIKAKQLDLHDVNKIDGGCGRLLSALFRDYSMLAAAYLLEPAHIKMIVAGEYGVARSVLPRNIAVPLAKLADRLHVQPTVDHHSYTLNNWYMDDPNAAPTVHNIQAVRRFLGGREERGFIAVHVGMAMHSATLVQAQQAGIHAAVAKDGDALTDALNDHADALHEMLKVYNTLWTVSDRSAYLKFRTFLMGQVGNESIFPQGVTFEGVSTQPMYFRGASRGQDSVIPSCDNFLGLSARYPENELTAHLRELRFARPRDHRAYLGWVESSAAKAGMVAMATSSSKSALALLRNLDKVHEIRMSHWKMTKKFIMDQTTHPVTTGGTPISTWLPNNLLATLEYMLQVHDQVAANTLNEADRKVFDSISERLELAMEQINVEVKQLQHKYYGTDQLFSEFVHRDVANARTIGTELAGSAVAA